MAWWRFMVLPVVVAIELLARCELSRASLRSSSAIAARLDAFVRVMNRLDEYDAQTEAGARSAAAQILFAAVDSLARDVVSTLHLSLPEALEIEGLPYAEFLRSAHHQQGHFLDSTRPNTPQKIEDSAKAWMCASLAAEITAEIDQQYAVELLFSDEYEDTDQGSKELQLDIREHIEWIHEIKRISLHLQSDKLHLEWYEHLFDSCVARNLALVFPK